MAQKRRAIDDLIQKATEAKIKRFENIRGKQNINFPYWDIVVITAADADQQAAYELQLKEKLARHQLPLGIKYHVLKDPGEVKIGPGGSMMAALSMLQTIYNQSLFRSKVLFIPAGGFSQRLPSASVLGKIFTAVPYGKPLYQMLDLILAMYIDLPAHMESGGVFLACADTIILYDCTVGVEWSFNKPGITAFGHPAPIQLGTTHGVFLLPEGISNVCSQVHIVECEEFLHKRSKEKLREHGALLQQSCKETLGINEDYVLVDGSFYMDGATAKKLIEFYEEKSPLTCEIDSHGDFLHGLGKRGNNTYINDTSNVSKHTDDLLLMRQEVFKLLQGTPLHVLVLPYSKFYHIGTTQELLYHYCDNESLGKELSLTKDAFNHGLQPNGGDERKTCIMNSVVPFPVDMSRRCVVEYCHFNGPCTLGEGSIVSGCVIQGRDPTAATTIPPHTFLHTAAVKVQGHQKRFVTIFFDTRDNLKKSVPQPEASQLGFLNTNLETIFNSTTTASLLALFPPGTPCSIWTAKLFALKETMEESFQVALQFLSNLHNHDDQSSPVVSEGCLSMADVLQMKDINAMVEYRRQLYALIAQD